MLTLCDQISKHIELSTGARTLTFCTAAGITCLRADTLQQFVAQGHNFLSTTAQEIRAELGRTVTIVEKSTLSSGDSGVYMSSAGRGHYRFKCCTCGGGSSQERSNFTLVPPANIKNVSDDVHGKSY